MTKGYLSFLFIIYFFLGCLFDKTKRCLCLLILLKGPFKEDIFSSLKEKIFYIAVFLPKRKFDEKDILPKR